MTRRLPLLVATTALCLALTACGGNKEQPEPSTTPVPSATTATPSATGPYESAATDSPTPVQDDDAEDDSLVNREADESAKQGAIDAAMATAEVWVQGKTMDQQQWNSALLATLSPIAQPAYDGRTWGYRVKATAITGDPAVTEATMTTATVTVPTDAGSLTLTVGRDDETAPWLTTAIGSGSGTEPTP